MDTSSARTILLGLLVSCCALAAPAGVAEEALEACTRPLTVGFYNFPPFYYQDAESGRWRGIDKDVVDELAARSGCRIEAVFESRVRIWAQMKNGALDLTTSALRTDERERYARFIPYHLSHNLLVLSTQDATAPVDARAALGSDTLTLAVTRSYRYGPPFDAWVARLADTGRVFESADEADALRLVALGRVTAAINRESALPFLATPYGQDKFRTLDFGGEPLLGHLVVSRARIGEPVFRRLADAVAAMRRDGTLRKIFLRHVPAPTAERMLPPAP